MIGPSREELEGLPTVMLQQHRGYYVKIIENTEDALKLKDFEIEERLEVLQEVLKERERAL